MTKIDRRIVKTKEAIHQAFIKLMSEKDFHEITVQNISDRANINRGTFYSHYIDKFDLLDKLIESELKNLLKFCESSNNNTVIQMNSFSALFKYFEQNHLFYSTMLTNKGAGSFRERFLKFVLDGIKNEVNMFEVELNQEITIQFVASAFVGIVEWWIINESIYSSEVMAENVKELINKHLNSKIKN